MNTDWAELRASNLRTGRPRSSCRRSESRPDFAEIKSGSGSGLQAAVSGVSDQRILLRLHCAQGAAKLGCVETVVGPPLVTSHVECTAEECCAAGIPQGLVRYSAGIEDVADLIDDLKQALTAGTGSPQGSAPKGLMWALNLRRRVRPAGLGTGSASTERPSKRQGPCPSLVPQGRSEWRHDNRRSA